MRAAGKFERTEGDPRGGVEWLTTFLNKLLVVKAGV